MIDIIEFESKDLLIFRQLVEKFVYNYVLYDEYRERIEGFKRLGKEFCGSFIDDCQKFMTEYKKMCRDRMEWLDELFFGDEDGKVQVIGYKEKQPCIYEFFKKFKECEDNMDKPIMKFSPFYFYETVDEYIQSYKNLYAEPSWNDGGLSRCLYVETKQTKDLIDSFINKNFNIDWDNL